MSFSHEIDMILARIGAPGLPGIELSLGRMQGLLKALGNPQLELPPIVHVAGTNGKGSTIAFVKAICDAAGLSVHRYTSPHLVRFHERIELGGVPVEDEVLLKALKQVEALQRQHPVTFFEATTAAALLCFSWIPADILLLEVGLGGRFDATNVVPDPLLSIITPIDYDHQDFLGNNLTGIAHEKAGILRKHGVCVIAPQLPEAMKEVQKVAASLGVNLRKVQMPSAPVEGLALAGDHQQVNAAIARVACRFLGERFAITDAHIEHGLMHAQWPARLQRLAHGPIVRALPEMEIYLDGGHNPHAASALAAWLAKREGRRHVWLGMRHGKDVEGFIEILAPCVDAFTALPIEECADAVAVDDLAAIIRARTDKPVRVAHALSDAASTENCDEKATLVICGSLYLAGNILKYHS